MTDYRVKIGMAPPHPGSFIRTEILEELDLSIAHAADILGASDETLADLMDGKSSLSPEMALRVEKAFGMSSHTLVRMGEWHDRCAAR